MSIDKSLYEAINKMESGKEEGFNVIYTRTYDFVYRRAKFMLKNEEDALDLVQETYIQAYKGISTLEDANNLYGWLGAITFRQGTKIIRKKKDVLLDEESEFIFEELENEDMDFEPGAKAEYRAIAEVVQQFIEELPELQKAAIMAYYYDNMKIDDIATAFECTPSTIKSRLNYAKNHIRERVISHEKKYQYALHSVSPAILFFAIEDALAKETYAVQTSVMHATYAKICKNVGLQIGRAVKTVGLSISKKIVLAISIPVLAVGGVIAAVSATENFVQEAGPDAGRENLNSKVEEVVVEEAEWVQAYKEYLYNEDDMIGTLMDRELDEARESDYWSGQLSGIFLYDMDEDGIPELFIRKTGERKANKIYVHSYVDGEVRCGGTIGIGNISYRGDYEGESIGYDKETNRVYYYAEIASSMEYWINIQEYTYDEWGLGYDIETSGCISEVEYEENSDWVWPTDRESLWETVYERNPDMDASTKDSLYNFIPFVWQEYTEDSIEAYVSEDYQSLNLDIQEEIENNIHEYFFVYPEDVDYVEILQERAYSELKVLEAVEEPFYFDSETKSVFRMTDALNTDVEMYEEYTSRKVYTSSEDGYVNYRMGPSTEYNVILQLANDIPLTKMCRSQDGKWYGVYYDGKFGWVASSQVISAEEHTYNREYTEEEKMRIRQLLEVPDDLEDVEFDKVDIYYWSVYDCVVVWIELYHNDEYIAGGCFTEELEALELVKYTSVK